MTERKTMLIYAEPTRDEIIKWAESALRNSDIGFIDESLIEDFKDGLSAFAATGQLVPAQGWQPIETMPDCVNVLVWARGWGSPSIGFIGFTSEGVGPYDPISGGAFDPRPTHWLPLPPPPAEGV